MAERVLLTGAAGFLGSACAKLLLKRGDEVIALVRDRDARSPFYTDGLDRQCVEVRAELADAERLMAEYRPDRVIHLGAQTQVPTANAAPLSTFESNVRGTWLLLEACRLAPKRPKGVLVASSDKAYGDSPLPYSEQGPLQPTAPYDVSKACTDPIARSYASQFGLPVVVTRCGNLYGPGDLNGQRLVPEVCSAIVEQRRPALRSTGRMSREWLYINDAATATLLLADRAQELPGQAFNVGSGQVATAFDVVSQLMQLGRCMETLEFHHRDPPGELMNQSLDSSRLRALGWRPQMPLQEGLKRTLVWTRKTASRARSQQDLMNKATS